MRLTFTIRELRAEARQSGRDAIRNVRGGNPSTAYAWARDAAHFANLALEAERRRDAPALTILTNRQRLAQRQASVLRCACGGKLKRKTARRQLVGVECARCGRYAAKPQEKADGHESAMDMVGETVGLAVSGAEPAGGVSPNVDQGEGVTR